MRNRVLRCPRFPARDVRGKRAGSSGASRIRGERAGPHVREEFMFDAIAKGFRQAKNRLAGLTELTEQNIETALREVRLSLLEADVELGLTKAFLARVKEKALGEVDRIRAKAKDGE